MKKSIAVASIWISAIASAGAFVYETNPPRDTVSSANSAPAQSEFHRSGDDQSTAGIAAPTVL